MWLFSERIFCDLVVVYFFVYFDLGLGDFGVFYYLWCCGYVVGIDFVV